MKLGNKILDLRKKKGYSQEELGDKIGVTRQTISNWELNETTPNPDQLKLLSNEFNVSIDDLLDNNIKSGGVRKDNALKIVLIILAGIVCFYVFWFVLALLYRASYKTGSYREESIVCNLYGEEHSFSIKYYEESGVPFELGGDAYFSDILDLDKYNDAHQIFNVINDYVKKNGGTCEMVESRDLSDIVNIEIKNLTNTSMDIVIHDESTNKIIYGSDFYIEKYVNGNWENVETIHDDFAFNAMAYYVNEKGILEMKQDWSYMYGPLKKGLYRIVKNVFFESDIPVEEEDKYYIWEEFEIE